MAKTGKITITTNSQSTANNTSSITVTGTITTAGESYRGDHRTGTYTIKQGSKVIRTESFSKGAPKDSTTTLFTTTLTVTHNSDGTSGTISASYNYDNSWCTASKTTTLKTIARASSITSASSVTLGNECSVKWTPASSSFQYKLKFSLGSWSYTTDYISPNTTSAYTYTEYAIPLDVAKQITSTTSGTMTVYLYTYNGTTQVGSTTSKTFTVTVPLSMVPKISSASVTIDNSANSVIKGWGLYVVGFSKAKITAAASGSYNSNISKFTISGGYSTTVSGASLDYTGGKFTSSGSKTFSVVVTDSRGRTSESKDAGTITVYAYSKPSISSFKVSRSSSNSTKMTVSSNWTYASVNGKNSTTGTLYYKKSSASSWTTYGVISRNTTTTLTTTFEETSSYDFKIVVQDSLSNMAEAESFISTVEVLMDFRAGGKGLGIGKIAESDSMEVAMKSNFYNNIYIDSNYEIRSLDADGNSKSILKGISTAGNTLLGYGNYTNKDGNTNIYGDQIHLYTNNRVYSHSKILMPNDVPIEARFTDATVNDMLHTSTSDNTVLGYGCYSAKKGNTHIYGNDVKIYSATAGETSYRPYYRAGDSVTDTWYLTGYVTSSGTYLYYTLPLSKPIIGSPTVTVSSDNGFQLRQNGKYTHGTSNSNDTWTYAKPSSYTAAIQDSGVRIRATFSNTTNATNMDTIGIWWNGTVTFS